MWSTEILAESLGDLMVVDVGGATTDVHSVTEGSPEFVKNDDCPGTAIQTDRRRRSGGIYKCCSNR